MPSASIIIPTYNRATHVSRSIESALDQTYADHEVIVVDDGSTDDTEDIVTGYDDPRVNYVYQENAGANAARNRGIKRANGIYISFLDSDDELHPDALKVSVEVLRREPTSCGGVATSYQKIRDGETDNVLEATDGKITRDDIVDGNVVGGFSCTTFRREVFDRVGFLKEGLPASQDYEFYLRVFEEYYMVGVPQVLTNQHIHGEQITTSINRKIEGQEYIVKEYGDMISNERRADHHYLRGSFYAETGKMRTAATEFKNAIKLDPTFYLYYFHFFASLLGKGGYDRAESVRRRFKLFLRGRLAELRR